MLSVYARTATKTAPSFNLMAEVKLGGTVPLLPHLLRTQNFNSGQTKAIGNRQDP